MNNDWKTFTSTCLVTALFMLVILLWDQHVLSEVSLHWSYIPFKTFAFLSCIAMAFWSFKKKKNLPWINDLYVLIFHFYSWYGMSFIDLRYSFSFVICSFAVALLINQTPRRYYICSGIGLVLTISGYFLAREPAFTTYGQSYKHHSFIITFILLSIGVLAYTLIHHYQRKVEELNERFALIGKQSSFLLHEIKNPLNRVVSNSEDFYSSEIMKDINHDSQKISGLVNSIETLIHSPETLHATFVHFDLSDIRSSLIKDYDSYLKSMNIDYDFTEFKGVFYGNQHLIFQLLKNLLINAIEAIGYRQEDKSLITIKIKRTEKNLIISFSNTNSFIDSQTIKKIFEPHFTTKKNGQNKGLGLCLSKSIVEAHHGTIVAKSKGNKTTFEIKVPDYSMALL